MANQTLNIPTQESVNAQITEMAKQIKAYVDKKRDTLPVADPTNIDFGQLYNFADGQDTVAIEDHITSTLPAEAWRGFCNMQNVNSITFDLITELNPTGQSVFVNMKKLKELHFPNLKTIGNTSSGTYHCIENLQKLRVIDMPNLQAVYENLTSTSYFCYNLTMIEEIVLSSLVLISTDNDSNGTWYCFSNNPALKTIELPAFQRLRCHGAKNYCFANNAMLERIYLPSLLQMSFVASGSTLFSSCPKLIDIEIGSQYDALNERYNLINYNMPFLCKWNPTLVLQDAEKTALLNKNIREHIAANCATATTVGGLTVTFSAAVFDALEDETFKAFTDKNWTVAGVDRTSVTPNA